MDDKWFKAQQRKVGVTAEDIAARMGRVRSAVSHIYSGRQRMSLDWAKVFAEVLQVPLSEVLERAGVSDPATVRKAVTGFGEKDAVPWAPQTPDDRKAQTVAELLGARPGVDVWTVNSGAMALAGLLPGDMMLIDTHQAERAKAGDVVLAQVYDNARGWANTVLRRYEPPVLVAASTDHSDQRVIVVDNVNAVIAGKVVASWRV